MICSPLLTPNVSRLDVKCNRLLGDITVLFRLCPVIILLVFGEQDLIVWVGLLVSSAVSLPRFPWKQL